MTDLEFRGLAISSIVDYFNGEADATDKNCKITKDDVYVVWQCKALQN